MVYNIEDTIYRDDLRSLESGIGAGAGINKIVIVGLVLKNSASTCGIINLLKREGLHVFQIGFPVGAGIGKKFRFLEIIELNRGICYPHAWNQLRIWHPIIVPPMIDTEGVFLRNAAGVWIVVDKGVWWKRSAC